MAVSTDVYTPTEDLILAKPRRRFGANVRWQHWQLRSLIGTDGQNHVYFPVPGSDNRNCSIQRLNTRTGEVDTVKRLTFNPRCLVARNGWVCCGGELGLFSAFRVGERDVPRGGAGRSDHQADGRFSVDFLNPTPALSPEARAQKDLTAQSVGFGKDRVNCITLWFPPTLVEPFEGAYDQDVAVLAHNDSSVIVVSLRDQEPLDKITYPDFMNRGVISPDGRLLIAISDDPYLYIHERREKKTGSGASARAADRPVYEWSACGRIQLKSQSKDDRSDNRGSFAACFSSTGAYLAVGTQYGTISVFDVAALTTPGAEPLITSFHASRPNAEFGAVRDMAFSPGPIDLLAWTEDRGRVGIADIRAGFDSRQILHLDRDGDFDELAVTDRGIADFGLDRGAADFRLFEPREEGEIGGSNGNSASGGGGAGSGTGSRPPWVERATRTAEGPRRERTASVSRAVNEILDNIRDQRERIRDTHDRLRTREESNAERRRYAASPLSGLSIALGTAGSGTGGRGALVSRFLANTANPTFSGGWDNVEALAAYLMREWEDSPPRRVPGTYMASHLRPEPYDTAGLAWSDQGDTLFVGAENAIYEFRVNLFGRRLSPSITFN
ncbi:hypothetical protein VTH06DRAFT_2969 [Thermothelomyces fergusii]